MDRPIARSKSLLLVVALTVLAAVSSAPSAQATAAGTGAAASHGLAASGSPCSFIPAQTCQSTDPSVTLNIDYAGNTSGCTFTWGVEWGDGATSPNLVVTNPPDGYVLLAQHTYTAPGTYAITVLAGEVDGSCTSNDFAVQFTLLPPPPTPAPAPPPSSPPPANAHGEACVFNAPTGGFSENLFGEHISGHVGWAYLADPATGTWEYGANEGPVDGIYLFPSRTWLAQGTWADARSAFKYALPGGNGKNYAYYHGNHYYATYRCASVAAIHPDAALKVAQNQNDEAYRIPGADCLSQTVEVLATYGAPISEYAYLANPNYWVPNHYYHSGYMSQFGPEHRL
jgi:hypothetical protein